MSSPNVQIQNLLRRYVREKENSISMNKVIDTLLPTSNYSVIENIHMNESNDGLCASNLTIPFILQTAYLTNLKTTFEYILDCEDIVRSKLCKQDDIFEMDDVTNASPIFQNNKSAQHSLNISPKNYSKYGEEVTQYMGINGILTNLYGAELVDAKWLLYGFIISKIHRTFKKNILTEYIQLKSLHIGKDLGNVQAVLHHLFTASETFSTMPVKWNWVSTDYNNVLYNTHKSNFIPILRGKSIWEQIILMVNKTAEIYERYNMIIYQINEVDNLRNQYLVAIIMALRFTDQHSVFLLEITKESEWTTLEINIIGLCGMIFDMVYLTKYNIDRQYSVLVCSDKKKNISTNMLLKKLIKILTESTSSCILNKNIFPQTWLDKVTDIISTPIEPVPFLHIINSISSILLENTVPLMPM